jgi:uncharacterized phage-associated protein
MRTVDIKDYTIYLGLSMLAKGLSVSPLKLQKLLYYQQSWHMVYFGPENTLFAEAPHAWVNGPVYPDIYREYRDKVPGMCDHLKLTDFVTEGTDDKAEMKRLVEKMGLSDKELELAERVIMLYGSKTQNQLILLTHSEKPWSEQREGMAPYVYSDKEMSLSTMYHYYKERYDRNRTKK